MMKTEFISVIDSLVGANFIQDCGVKFENGTLSLTCHKKVKSITGLTPYMITPRSYEGYLLAEDLQKAVEMSILMKTTSNVIMVPAECGFKFYKHNPLPYGQPKLIEQVKFYSIKSWLPKLVFRLFNKKLTDKLKF